MTIGLNSFFPNLMMLARGDWQPCLKVSVTFEIFQNIQILKNIFGDNYAVK